MPEIIQIAGHQTEILRRARQRNMNLRVRPDGTLRVTCAKGVSKFELSAFVVQCTAFIEKELARLREQRAKFPPKRFVGDERYLYLGERRPLQVIWSWDKRSRVQALDDRIELVTPLKSSVLERQAALHKFLRKQARQIFSRKVGEFARQMELYPASLSIRGQRTRWGSCSSKGAVNLNWKLLAAPDRVIDYVVIHELAHLKHMDHSPRFWGLVERHFPDHLAAKKWLRAHEAEIAAQFGR